MADKRATADQAAERKSQGLKEVELEEVAGDGTLCDGPSLYDLVARRLLALTARQTRPLTGTRP